MVTQGAVSGFHGAVFSEGSSEIRPNPSRDFRRSLPDGGKSTITYGVMKDGRRFFVAGPLCGFGTTEPLFEHPVRVDDGTSYHVIDNRTRVIAVKVVDGVRLIDRQIWPEASGPIYVSHDDLVDLICQVALAVPLATPYGDGYHVDTRLTRPKRRRGEHSA
jgi:hypothetical protein